MVVAEPSTSLAASGRSRRGWAGRFPWYSSRRSDFSYDFHASFDESRGPIEYNYRGRRATAFRTGACDTLRYHDEYDD